MTSIKMYEGKLLVQGGWVCFVVSRFNSFIVEQLQAVTLAMVSLFGSLEA